MSDTRTLKVVILGNGDGASGALGKVSAKAADVGKKFALVGAGVALAMGGAAVAAVKSGLQTAASMEQAQIAFTTLLKSGQKSKDFLSKLSTFAAATPFELPGLIDASRQLLGAGASAKSVIPTLTAYGDAAGALGIDQDHFNNIMLATTQAMSAGKLQAGDLLQMTEAGLPVWKLLSEATGKPVVELRKLSASGQLLTKDVLPKLQAQMEKDYGGAMSKQSQTLSGLWSTLMDTFHQGMAKSLIPLEPMLRSMIPKAADLMGKALNKLTGFITKGSHEINVFLKSWKSGDVESTNSHLQNIAANAGNVFAVLKDGSSAVAPEAQNKLTKAAGAIHDGFVILVQLFKSQVEPELANLWQWVQVQLWPALQQLGQALLPIAQSFIPPLIAAFQALHQPIQDIVIAVLQGIVPAIQAASDWVQKHQVLIGALASAIAAIVTVMQVWKGIMLVVTVVTKAFAAVQAALNLVLDANPIGIVVIALAALAAAFVYAYNHSKTFRDIVNGVWSSVKEWAEAAWHGIEAAVHAIVVAWQDTCHALVTAWDNTKKAVSTAISDTVQFFKDLPGNCLKAAAGLGGLLLKWGKDALAKALAGVTAGAIALTAWWVGLPGQILGWIGNLGQLLLSAGEDVINGLIKGIKNKIKDVGNVIGSIASGIKDKFTSLMGIASPSKVFKKYGEWTMDGFHDGVMSRMIHVREAITKATQQILAPMKQALADLKKQKADYAAQVADQAKGGTLSGITGASYTDQDGNQQTAPLTAGDIQSSLQGKLAGVQKFLADVKKLAGMGLSKSLLSQIFGMGPTDGLPFAEALVNGGQTALNQINDFQSAIDATSNQLGAFAGDNQFGSQIAAEQHEINVTIQVAGNVTAEKDLAKTIATAVREELAKEAKRNGKKP
jgi:tape measure domain-containing protein